MPVDRFPSVEVYENPYAQTWTYRVIGADGVTITKRSGFPSEDAARDHLAEAREAMVA